MAIIETNVRNAGKYIKKLLLLSFELRPTIINKTNIPKTTNHLSLDFTLSS